MKAKRIGRPVTEVAPGSKASLGLRVTSEFKKKIDELARASGRSHSDQVEFLVERALHNDEMLAAMGTTLEEIKRGNIKAAMAREGWPLRPLIAVDRKGAVIWRGKAYVPPDYPGQRSHWEGKDDER